MAVNKTLKFEPSARLQTLIGRELMASDYVAIAEIIRNAYDAGARSVVLTFVRSSPERLTILDNGSGMSIGDFKKSWMMPGYSEKAATSSGKGRAQLGEKGIGRFAVDKIAKQLVLTTKVISKQKAIRVYFNWELFSDQKKKLSSIRIPVSEVHDEELLKIRHGTRLELIGLRKEWSPSDWKALRDELKRLINPIAPTKSFKIIANSSDLESGEITPKFDGTSGYHYFFTVNKSGRVIWQFTRPDKVLKLLKAASANSKKVQSGTLEVENAFGPVQGDFYFFDRASEIKKQDVDAGVAIYRDAFRVEPYGRIDDDWLGVKSLGASRQGHAPITPSKLVGFIQITRQSNPVLRDLTNRDGIQESPEFTNFQEVVRAQFDQFARLVDEDSQYLPKSPAISAQKSSATRQSRSEAISDLANQLAHQLRQPMNNISLTVNTLDKYVSRTFGEDDKIEKYTERIKSNITRLDRNIQTLASLAKNLQQPPEEFDLHEFLSGIIDTQRPDFDASGIQLIFKGAPLTTKVKFSQPALQFAIENYLSNAFKATNRRKSMPDRSVIVRVNRLKNEKIRISVEDFGDGIPDERRQELFTKPVASSDGNGFGLFYSKTHIEAFDGEVGCESAGGRTTVFVDIA